MAIVKVNGIEKTYPEGTTYLEIAREFQDQYENDILLVRVNGKLRELEKTLAGRKMQVIRRMSAVRSF